MSHHKAWRLRSSILRRGGDSHCCSGFRNRLAQQGRCADKEEQNRNADDEARSKGA